MPTLHIHIQGQVQGVGFRPYVYKMAISRKLKGWVSNTSDGVHIELTGSSQEIQAFYDDLITKPPDLAIITKHAIEIADEKLFDDFRIIESKNEAQINLLLTPDYGICTDCLRELTNPQNRRYQYPFITCTNCGPRYSIIQTLPYDRATTTMSDFSMCEVCNPEYNNPLDRRYYSQTNSCPNCAVELFVANLQIKIQKTQHQIIKQIGTALRDGQIVAVKGIGGYLLMADATNRTAIQTLRKRKHRPTKPFALMYPSQQMLLLDVETNETELKAFRSIESPIVLFALKKHYSSQLQADLVAPGLNQIGVMQPYTPLYVLIMQQLNVPIIATSGNISGSPILFDDATAAQLLAPIADLIVGNNRPIVVPQDDSVVRFSPVHNQKIVVRRSRGLAPNFVDKHNVRSQTQTILAMGAGLKSSLGMYHQNNTYISQYMGNINSFESQQSYDLLIEHWKKVFNTKPQKILTDKHPHYYSTQKGEEIAHDEQLPVFQIQHHKAHFAAVLGENGLINSNQPVLGVIWDGVGLGDDQQIWGGEFFRYQNKKIQRIAHFEYFKHIAFDNFAMHPRIPALSLCAQTVVPLFIQKKFQPTELKNYNLLLQKPNQLLTSSVGRLFDAVASILNIKNINSFEGEAAMLLENEAGKADFFKYTINHHYLGKNSLSTTELIQNIIKAVQNKEEKKTIAFKFHVSLVKIIEIVAQKNQVEKIAFSGGVFQNALLTDLIIEHLSADYELFFHQSFSPNDENISYGQLIYHENNLS